MYTDPNPEKLCRSHRIRIHNTACRYFKELHVCVQSWDAAGAGQNADDRNFLSWALSLIMDLLFPGKKPKDVIEDGQADNIDPGKKKKDDNVKVWKRFKILLFITCR
jgi:hypothetical protein